MALDPKRLAPHRARSVASIVLKATAPDGKLIPIGAIKSLERTISRNIIRRRELDSNPPGVTIELIPGATTTIELRISRAMLYKTNLLEGFGIYGVEDLIEQNIPLEIHEVRNNPDGTRQTIVYKGCYFKENPMSVDIDGDWVIFQQASLDAAQITVSGTSQKANITPDNFSAFAPADSAPKLL